MSSVLVDSLEYLRIAYPWPETCPIRERMPRVLGWGQPEDLLRSSITADMRIILELGSWLGESARFFLDWAPRSTVICVDHWEGSSEHIDEVPDMLDTLYEDFLAINWSNRDRIIPIRATTIRGLELVASVGIVPDLIYVDADHHYESVLAELEVIDRLFPDSVLIGDDYGWRGVHRAVHHFVGFHGYTIRAIGRGWKMRRKFDRER